MKYDRLLEQDWIGKTQTGRIVLPTGVVEFYGKMFVFIPDATYIIRRVRWYDRACKNFFHFSIDIARKIWYNIYD